AEQLQEVFKRTSAFTVRSTLLDDTEIEALDDIELWKAEYDINNTSEFEEADDYLDFDDDMWDEEFGVPHKSLRRGQRQVGAGGAAPKSPRLSAREQIIQRYKYMQVRIQDRHGHTFFVKRKVNAIDPSMPTYVRIPPSPIPRSWVKHIVPLNSNGSEDCGTAKALSPSSRYEAVSNILDYDFPTLGTNFHAVYMDPPLVIPGQAPKSSHYFCIKDL
ncbi:hypothetical protein EV182_007329, partial [Spiromyces aspiralis]